MSHWTDTMYSNFIPTSPPDVSSGCVEGVVVRTTKPKDSEQWETVVFPGYALPSGKVTMQWRGIDKERTNTHTGATLVHTLICQEWQEYIKEAHS